MRTLTIAGVAHAPDGSGYYRMYLPWQHLGRNSRHILGMAPPGQQPPLGPEDVEQLDVLVLQRPAGRIGTRQLERLAGHVKLVYETDDDMLQVDPSGLPHLYDEQMRASIRRCLRLADLVTVSTPYLAEQVAPYNDRVRILPNYVKAGLLGLQRPRRERLTIGMAGGTSHLVDLMAVAEPLRQVLDANPQADMHFMGYDYSPVLKRAGDTWRMPRHPQCRWSTWQQDVGAYYKQIDFDIAIAPLADVPFNWSKSWIRALEMAALGIPVVAANVGPYRDFVLDGKTGFLVNDNAEFAARLTDLVCDEAARAEMGAAAREHAAGYTIEGHWMEWEAAYEEVAGG